MRNGNGKKDANSFSAKFRRAMVGEIPATFGECVLHDIVGTVQGLIPFVPEPAGIFRTKRKLEHKHLSESAKNIGATMQAADVVISAIDPSSLLDAVFFESTLWYMMFKDEIKKVHEDKKLWSEKEYELFE